jgi:CRP/FNR family cyclic AMP-dependent transcriptional regulator
MSDKELFDLGETYLFRELDPGVIDFIRKKAVVKKLSRKEYISYAEDMDVIFIVKKGKVKISYLSEDGREMTIMVLSSGDIYSRHSQALVRAVTKTEIWQFTGRDFSEILDKDPLIARRLIVILGRILRQTNEVVKNLAFEEVGVRLARFILDQGQEYGVEDKQQTVIEMELTHEDIATLTATSRQTVTSILSRMEKDGIISTGKKQLIILNKEKLEETAKYILHTNK